MQQEISNYLWDGWMDGWMDGLDSYTSTLAIV